MGVNTGIIFALCALLVVTFIHRYLNDEFPEVLWFSIYNVGIHTAVDTIQPMLVLATGFADPWQIEPQVLGSSIAVAILFYVTAIQLSKGLTGGSSGKAKEM